MDNRAFKIERTRHESLQKPILHPQSINVELLFRQVILLQQEREQWKAHCERLEKCNKTTNDLNDSLLSRVAILEDVLLFAFIDFSGKFL